MYVRHQYAVSGGSRFASLIESAYAIPIHACRRVSRIRGLTSHFFPVSDATVMPGSSHSHH